MVTLPPPAIFTATLCKRECLLPLASLPQESFILCCLPRAPQGFAKQIPQTATLIYESFYSLKNEFFSTSRPRGGGGGMFPPERMVRYYSSLLLRRFVFRMAEARAKRVTGDEPQGAMGRVPSSPSRLPLRAHFHQERDVWVRGRYYS